MAKQPHKISIAEVAKLNPEKWAVAVLYSDKSMNINVLGSGYSMAHSLAYAVEEEQSQRQAGDKEIRVVIVDRASIKFMELK